MSFILKFMWYICLCQEQTKSNNYLVLLVMYFFTAHEFVQPASQWMTCYKYPNNIQYDRYDRIVTLLTLSTYI